MRAPGATRATSGTCNRKRRPAPSRFGRPPSVNSPPPAPSKSTPPGMRIELAGITRPLLYFQRDADASSIATIRPSPPGNPASSKSILTPHGCQTRGVVYICDHAGAQAKGRRYLRRSHFLRPTPNTQNDCPAVSPGLLENRALKAQGGGRAAFDLVSTLGFLGHLLLRPIVGRFSVGALQAAIDGAPRGRRPTILLYWRDFFRGSSICARSFTWGASSRFRVPPPT